MKLKKKVTEEKNVEKIVVLNSGGFDSVCLSHEIDFENPDAHITDLFFDWGQLCLKSEEKCSKNCAEKLNHKWEKICIPKFSWSDSVLTGGDNESQYVPLRNLVFISYALSYAKAIGATKIFCAFINPLDEYYEDTSPLFVDKVNSLAETFGIKVEAPFVTYTKDVLLKSLARNFGITIDEIHSCNFGDEPCNNCTDCESINTIFEDIDLHLADDILIDNQFEPTKEFVEVIKNTKVKTAKVYVNNSCQFNCTHCFIGKTELVSKPLSDVEWEKLFKSMKEYGIIHIDFFGKEPLYDDSVFKKIEVCQKLGITVSLITNGVNVSKYINQLEKYKPVVAMSVESLGNTEYRTTGKYILDSLKLLISKNIPVSVSIDLSRANIGDLPNIMKKLAKIGVNDYYIKPIRPFGASEEKLMKEMLSSKEILSAVDTVIDVTSKLGVNSTMSFAMMDLYRMYKECPEKFNDVLGYAIQNRLDVVDGVKFEFELFCHRYSSNISITPDGYVLGCASEYCTNYAKMPNIRNKSLAECIEEGKNSLKESSFSNLGCYFCKKYCIKNEKIFKIG